MKNAMTILLLCAMVAASGCYYSNTTDHVIIRDAHKPKHYVPEYKPLTENCIELHAEFTIYERNTHSCADDLVAATIKIDATIPCSVDENGIVRPDKPKSEHYRVVGVLGPGIDAEQVRLFARATVEPSRFRDVTVKVSWMLAEYPVEEVEISETRCGLLFFSKRKVETVRREYMNKWEDSCTYSIWGDKVNIGWGGPNLKVGDVQGGVIDREGGTAELYVKEGPTANITAVLKIKGRPDQPLKISDGSETDEDAE